MDNRNSSDSRNGNDNNERRNNDIGCLVCKLKNNEGILKLENFLKTFNKCNPLKSIKVISRNAYKYYTNEIYILNSKLTSSGYQELPQLTINDFHDCLINCERTPMHSLKSDFEFCSSQTKWNKNKINEINFKLSNINDDDDDDDVNSMEEKLKDNLDMYTTNYNNFLNNKIKLTKFFIQSKKK